MSFLPQTGMAASPQNVVHKGAWAPSIPNKIRPLSYESGRILWVHSVALSAARERGTPLEVAKRQSAKSSWVRVLMPISLIEKSALVSVFELP